MPNTPVNSPSRPRSALRRLPSYRSLSFSASKLSLSHVTPDPANRYLLNKTDGSSRIENFCSHPIKSTRGGVRKLLQKASHSLRFTHRNELLDGMKRDKCPGTLGDGESGIVIDDKDNDCFYAIDTTVARKGPCVL